MTRRVVVTGLGAVTPIGTGLEKFWDAVLSCQSGADEIKAFDTSDFAVHIGCEVSDFDPESYLERKEARNLDRVVHFAIGACQQAVDDSGIELDNIDRTRVGCVWGSGIGGLIELENQHSKYLERGPRRISPFFIPKLMVNASPGQVAIRFKLQGPNFGVASACASAQHAIGLAFREVKCGSADVMITGGSEATVSAMGLGGFCALRALSKRNDDPKTASRPFTAERDGFVMGEGGGGLIFEEYEHAKARGASIYGEVLGFGMTDDGFHISAPVPEGTSAARAMNLSLVEAGLQPEDVDYVNAHGTSTQLNDVMETRAVRTAFNDHADKLMVSSTKSQIGHLLGASGAVEAVVCFLALKNQIAPPTINYSTPDPDCDLDYVPNEPRETRIRAAISNSFGFGGHNVTMAFGAI